MSRDSGKELPAVVITGASTGIGAACAIDLDRRGFRVFAGVRKQSDGQRLQSEASGPLVPVMIDVTDTDAIRLAAEEVGVAVGTAGLAGLVNNAGIVVPGPAELVSLEDWRRQLEVNVIGQLAVTQALLPLLRKHPGRIVNMGSISGRIAPPYMGPYTASKFSLEAITDVLRVELRRWGIHVSIIEPDTISTPIWGKMQQDAEGLQNEVAPEVRELYEQDFTKMGEAIGQMTDRAMSVDHVVKAVRHALCARRPRTRYPIGWRTRLGFWAFKSIPDRMRDWILLKMMGIS